jgi:hypothetical protein
MPSVCIRTLLFTPIGKEPKQNLYIQVFLLWLSQLLHSANLKPTDALELLIDTPTLRELENSSFNELLKSLQCEIKLLQMNQPATLTEGCMWKYLSTHYTQDVFFYCDIDILILKPVQLLTDLMKPDTVYAHIEGLLHHPSFGPNYTADFPAPMLASFPPDSPGYSAGKFLIYGSSLRDFFFQYIHTLHSKRRMDYPMLEQPFYNRALYELRGRFSLDTTLLTNTILCRNNTNYSKSFRRN